MTQRQNRNDISASPSPFATADIGYVIAVDIGGTNLRLALADLTGIILKKWSSSTVGIRGAEAIVALIRDGVDCLLQQVSAERHALKAVAAGAPGITDFDAGVVIATSYLMGWRDVPLRTLLESALGASVAVDNDVNLAAVGEKWAGAAKEERDFAFLAIGTGIGAGIVLNGRLFRGMGWAAGEIGYMLVPGAPDTHANRGEPGTLESTIGGEGIRAQWQNLWRPDNTALPSDLTATQIFDNALIGDALAQTILQKTSRALAHAICNVYTVVDCPLFVLGGGVGMHPALVTTTRSILQDLNLWRQPKVIISALGSEAQLVGGIRLALDLAGFRTPLLAGDRTGAL